MTEPQPDPDVFLLEDSETFADCTLRAGDYAVSAVAALDEGGPEPVVRAVYLATSLSGDEGAVLLAPADARRLAAGLLNAADAVEGVTPIYLLGEARGSE